MSVDKFLTDLAAHTGVDNVTVSCWPKHSTPVEVALWISAGVGHRFAGEGANVEIAMQAALAKLRTHRALAELASIDADLIDGPAQ